MPELPEVETTLRGIEPYLCDQRIRKIVVRNRRLRWPVPADIENEMRNIKIQSIARRAKYLIFETESQQIIVHLGMSGHLRFLSNPPPAAKHDHIDWVFNHGTLRYTDPRRFGCVLLTHDASRHPLITALGPEPLSNEFYTEYLYNACRNRRVAIKQHIMNAKIVVGVGNIYASESLYRAGIHPSRAASRISKIRIGRLVTAIREVLEEAIAAGGTSLRDFVQADGKPGYFRVQLAAYEADGSECARCGNLIRRYVLGQRATYYCPGCQR